MKKILCSALLLALMTPGVAHAGPKFYGMWWWWTHWKNQDYNPYYDNGTDPHNSQWSNSNWTPANWISSVGGDGQVLIKKWKLAEIIRENDEDWDHVPYLVIGPNFYHLSGYDKRRVVETVDAIYKMTEKKPGLFYVRDYATDKIIGTYTKQGLTLE